MEIYGHLKAASQSKNGLKQNERKSEIQYICSNGGLF